jgi:peptidoglycan hydrolase-like protein with peptidoglycan-binding domain
MSYHHTFSNSCFLATLSCTVLLWSAAAASAQQLANTVRNQQDMLVWTTDYEGLIDGNLGAGTVAAIKKFQTRLGQNADGVLTEAQWKELARQGSENKKQVGFTIRHDNKAGVRIGIPVNLVAGPTTTRWGENWYKQESDLSIDTLRFGPQISLKQLYDRLVSINNRDPFYTRLTDDWFVIAAFEGVSAVYVAARTVKTVTGTNEIRGFSIWMGKGRPQGYEALPSAMLSSFSPFEPGGPTGGTFSSSNRPKAPVNPKATTIIAQGPVISLEECWRGLGNCPRVLNSR